VLIQPVGYASYTNTCSSEQVFVIPLTSVHASLQLFPCEPDEFWEHIRSIIREEVARTAKEEPSASLKETKGLINLYAKSLKFALFSMFLYPQCMSGLKTAN